MSTNDIEIIPIGGYTDFGRNMTAVRVGREIVIFDMGVKLDPLQQNPNVGGVDELDVPALREMGAIPDDRILQNVDGKVVAIVIGHAHNDHVGAVAKLAGRYKDAPIIGSPYTIKYVEDLAQPFDSRRNGRDGKRKRGMDRLSLPNQLIPVTGTNRVSVGKGKLQVELVHVTHSIVGSTLPVLHTPKGAIVYGLDFKLDDTPVLGSKPDYRRLGQLGREGVYAFITESTNAHKDEKTDSEMIARYRVRDLLFGVDHERESIFMSTFSSNAARIHSIIDYAQDLNREVLILGRSMERYQRIAADLGVLDLPSHVRIMPNRETAQNALRMVEKDRTRYLVVLTGHQGEPGALLTRMASNDTPYRFTDKDDVIFSSNVIPTETTIAQRADLEMRLRKAGVRVFKGAHVSGHAARVDHQEMLHLLNPEHVIPAHGGIDLQSGYASLATEMGWKLGRDLHILENQQRFIPANGPSPVPKLVEPSPLTVMPTLGHLTNAAPFPAPAPRASSGSDGSGGASKKKVAPAKSSRSRKSTKRGGGRNSARDSGGRN